MSQLMSYLFTGLPADSTDRTRSLSMVVLAVMVMVALLAFVPSWPLTVGVAAGCALLGYIVHRLFAGSPGSST